MPCHAMYVFADPFGLSIPDDDHSENEERWLLLGNSLSEQILLVVHTIRCNDVIRIISASKRQATKKRPISRGYRNERRI